MKKLTRFEEAFLEDILKKEKRKAEEYLEYLEYNDKSFEAYFVKNETLPMIKNLLKKIEV